MDLQSSGKVEPVKFDTQNNNYNLSPYNNNKKPADNNNKNSVDTIDTFKVLLVEDDKVLQLVNKCLLAEFGCHVEIAEDGQSALDKFNLGYDLVLMDIGLPDIDGIEVTRQIRQQQPDSTIVPIVALTAHSDEGSVSFCFESGMNGYISKPLSINKISDLIKQCVQYSSKTSSTV